MTDTNAIETRSITAGELRKDSEEIWEMLSACDDKTYQAVISLLTGSGSPRV